MAKGRIKWFHADRGYGFIEQDDGEDAFIHVSNVRPGDAWTLISASNLRSATNRRNGKLYAVNLRILELGEKGLLPVVFGSPV